MKQMRNSFPWTLAALAALWLGSGVGARDAVADPSEHHVYLHVVQPAEGAPVRIIVSESDVLKPVAAPLPIENVPPVEDPVVEAVLDALAEEPPAEESAAAVDVPVSVAGEDIDLAVAEEPSADVDEDAAIPPVKTVITPLPPEAVTLPSDGALDDLALERDAPPMGLLLFIFVLAIFLGFELISKVPSQLHTPLMSGSNAISGITIVGALAAAGLGVGGSLGTFLGTLAVAFATINVVGGYMVTNRMLAMFKKKDGGAR